MLQELLLPAHLSTARTPIIPRHCLSWQSPPQCLVCLDSLFSLLIKIQKCLSLQWALLFVCFILFYFLVVVVVVLPEIRLKTSALGLGMWGNWSLSILQEFSVSKLHSSILGSGQISTFHYRPVVFFLNPFKLEFNLQLAESTGVLLFPLLCSAFFVMILNRASSSLSCDNRKEQTQTHSQPLQLSHRPREN